MNIDLMPFCDHEPYRCLDAPFSQGEWTYATNGHIAVRVPRLAEIPERQGAPPIDVEKVFIDNAATTYEQLPWFDLSPSQCSQCGGLGRRHKCPDCECECALCDGSGVAEPIIEIGRLPFAGKYIRLMRALPGIEIGSLPKEEFAPLPFRFSGGEGVVMPRRR
jgi:hypothetical protein